MNLRPHIPNLLTFARVAAVPLCLLLMACWPEASGVLFGVFVLASATDFLDGYLARRWQVVSAVGAWLDPVADKLLVALLLLHLAMGDPALLVPASLMVLRDLYISSLREFLASRQVPLPVSRAGKLKTALQLLGIGTLLAAPAFHQLWLEMPGTLTLWLAMLVSVASAVDYTRAGWQGLRP